MEKIRIGSVYRHEFMFTQEDVNAFSEITGDKNPIHLDEEYASKSIFKQRIIHGFLAGSVFSKILATYFPGEGTIYLEQSMKFVKPMRVDKKYTALFEVMEILPKNRARITTLIVDENDSFCLKGEAVILNIDRIQSV